MKLIQANHDDSWLIWHESLLTLAYLALQARDGVSFVGFVGFVDCPIHRITIEIAVLIIWRWLNSDSIRS